MNRLVSRLLLMLAVLLMPFGMTAAPAAPAHHGAAASMPMQHCPEQAPVHNGKAGFVQCTMACSAALPATDFRPLTQFAIVCAPEIPAAAERLYGLHPETATPPPKNS